MTRNNVLLLSTLALLAVVLTSIKLVQSRHSATALEPIVLYHVLPHPYFTGVGDGGKAYAQEHNVGVRIVVGQESTQANVNQNIDSLLTLGHKAFSIYPVDPAGSKGLFARLHRAGRRLRIRTWSGRPRCSDS